MAGILNNKTRVMDIIITDEGKRQAAAGELRVRYATFTDRHAFYEDISGSLSVNNATGVAGDASERLYFEAHSMFQDRVIVETEEAYSLDGHSEGRVRPFMSKDFTISGGKITSSSSDADSVRTFPSAYAPGLAGQLEVSGSGINSKHMDISNAILDHFQDQMIIGSKDPFYPDRGFKISVTPSGDPNTPGFQKSGCVLETDPSISEVFGNIKFAVTHFSPIYFPFGSDIPKGQLPSNVIKTVESSESFFQDKKLQHLPNYLYLPPVNEIEPGQAKPMAMGKYAQFQQGPGRLQQWSDIQNELQSRPYFEVDFEETSRDNNILCQMFEYTPDGVKKLSIIDFGSFNDPEGTPGASPGKRVFFVGKIYRDLFGSLTFINMFTVVFD
jgi:hypothetical protein